ncbi:MAG: carbohydrate ABC transporter permease [Chloroflexi bacterium]|nr:carbohydrate ABC transporter permease [Chloroflexota bacterium]
MRRVRYFLPYPFLIVGGIVMVLPLYMMLATSFKSTVEFYADPFGLPHHWDLGNYANVWFQGQMNVFFKNSVIISLGTVLLTLSCATLAGYALARLRMPGSTVIFYVLLAALMVPTEIILLPLFVEFRDLHLLNTYPSLIIPYASLGMAFSTYLLRGFFKSLPAELAEAARIDGAGEFATFWRVMLPLALPGVATVAIFAFMGAWSEFFLATLFVSNPDLRPLTAGLFGFSGTYQTNWGALSAGYTIVIAPIVLLFLLLQRYFIRGLTMGALKG